MKINNPLPPAVPVEQGPSAPLTRAPAEGAPKAAPGLVASQGAKVELSSTAASLRTSAAPAELDAAKVERIAQSIAEGRFKVNAEVIADKLIANAQELLGKVQR
ncbi:MAG: flagellar biosynthesis anti-sigma factor FlgM [Burkholderiaceae bacterium]|nr:flagellar biosynthesis anti-sigma factor FlgM [Burkholderiaceae bacterium]